MDLFQAAIYGIVQGLTEFLPISSSAHLILLPRFMHWPDPGPTFDIALHIGTLIPLLIYFRKEWIEVVKGGINLLRGRLTEPNARLALYIVFASIPAGLIGVMFQDTIETTFRNPLIISATLILLALVLVIAERTGRRKTDIDHMTFSDAMSVGCAQALALVPGVSRSGVTITAGLFRGMRREAAARFSFLLSTPVIAGAGGLELVKIARGGLPSELIPSFVVGMFVAAVVGYLAIALLIRYLATHNTYVFVYYRIVLGVIVYFTFA
jgi:undecaprenyl-diphosphatase